VRARGRHAVVSARASRTSGHRALVVLGGLLLVTGIVPTGVHGQHGGYLEGVALAFGAALLYAFATIIAKSLTAVRPQVIALIQALVGIPLLLPLADLAATTRLGPRWGWLAGLGVIHTCVMYILIYSSFQKLPTSRIAVLSFIYPVAAVVADRVVFGHHLTLLQALGIPPIVAASLAIGRGWRLLPGRPAGSPSLLGHGSFHWSASAIVRARSRGGAS